MAISLQKLCLVLIWVFLVFFLSSNHSLSHLMPNRCLSHESQVLLRIKADMNDSENYLFSSWVNGTDCCTMWNGISCNNHTNHVDVLLVSGNFQGLISESLCHLRFLTILTIRGVTGTLPPCLGNLPYIRRLYLSVNNLGGTIPSFICFLTHLTHLNLYQNEFNGSIPSCLANLSSLEYLSLSYNQLSGNIPTSLGSLTLLRSLRLEGNSMSGNIPYSLGNLSLLQMLYLGDTHLSWTIPTSFTQLSSLVILHVDGNRFNETISSPSLPPSLVDLRLSLNHNLSISETFFHNLTSLNIMYLSDCVLNISKTWIPSFQLTAISLVSCRIDNEIPPWISTQFSLDTLEIVNSGLVGEIPSWLWESSPRLQYLNLSGNHLEGTLFSNISISMQLKMLDVSRNALSGHIPSIWPPNLTQLLVNDNLFSGIIPSSLGRIFQLQVLNLANNNLTGVVPVSLGRLSQLWVLYVANNHLTGVIPMSLGRLSKLFVLNLANNYLTGVIPVSLSNCSSLIVINLGNNSLEGRLPHEFSKLSELYSLVAHNNNLNGSFPHSIVNCSKLQVLDIGSNILGGEIPKLIGNISVLRVLVMKENNFIGSIPLEIGQLRSLQILHLSSNKISGSIPHTIVSLQAMTIEGQDGFILATSNIYYQDGLDMILKGTNQHYEYILSTLTSIDLSNNKLNGEVASNFGNLKGLRLLNLSMNNLNGTIPNSVGEMSQLESLDLSRNNFSGKIPIEIESLNSLGSLNLSNNNLSGIIPQVVHIVSTFGESSFLGNPRLWGCPLPKNCSWPHFAPPPVISMIKEEKNTKYPWYKIAVALSYGVSFGGMLSLIFTRISWKRKYFNKVDEILKFFFPWMKNLTL